MSNIWIAAALTALAMGPDSIASGVRGPLIHLPLLLNPVKHLYTITSACIMSCSSCSRMWQCHTYSAPLIP
jgi:hypothetical protein